MMTQFRHRLTRREWAYLGRAVFLATGFTGVLGTAWAAGPDTYTTNITGANSHDQAYVENGDKSSSDTVYTFNRDITIQPAASSSDYAAIQYTSGSTPLTVENEGHKLMLTMNDGSRMMLDGILNRSGKQVTVNSDTDITVNNTHTNANAWGIYAFSTDKSHIDVNGSLNISTNAENVSHAVDVNSGSTVNLNGKAGGTIRITAGKTASDAAAVAATGKDSVVNINYERGDIKNADATVQIDGDLYTVKVPYGESEYPSSEANGTINIGLTGKNSYLHGVAGYRADQTYDEWEESGDNYYSGDVNLYMRDGATWTNEAYAKHTGTEWTQWDGSQIAVLNSNGGIVNQNDSKTLSIKTYRADQGKGNQFFQNGTGATTIDSYFGDATVFYKHDAKDPNTMLGGNFTIKKAGSDSTITLVTDREGITADTSDTAKAADWNTVSEVMNKLAQKLYYEGTAGNLTGKVEIAEGLLTSSVLRSGDITFVNRQGTYAYTPKDPSQDVKEQTTTEFSDPIFGIERRDTAYTDANVRGADGTYKFTKDSTITLNRDDLQQAYADGSYNSNVSTGVVMAFSADDGASETDGSASSINIDAAGHSLTLSTGADNEALAEQVTQDDTSSVVVGAIGRGTSGAASLAITADTLHLARGDAELFNNKGYPGVASGIWADNNAKVTVNGNVEISGVNGPAITAGAYGGNDGNGNYLDNSVTVNGDVNISHSAMGVDLAGGKGKIVITGKTTISDVDTASQDQIYEDALVNDPEGKAGKDAGLSVGGLSGSDSVSIGNAGSMSDVLSKDAAIVIGAADINVGEGYNAAHVRDGAIAINTGAAGTKQGTTTITGNLVADRGELDLVLGGADAYLKGLIRAGDEGQVNLGLMQGAYWDDKGTTTSTLGAKLNSLDADQGQIFMNDAADVTVNNFSGKATIFYTHDAKDPTIINGGNFKILNAADKSQVNLVTDRGSLTSGFAAGDSAADRNLVSEVLNKLAQKLYYTGTSGRLTGTVTIAEGLTTSSATLKGGDITFSDGSNGLSKGQGFYAYTPDSSAQTKTEFSNPIFGIANRDQEYTDAKVRTADGNYKFTKDSTITLDDNAYVAMTASDFSGYYDGIGVTGAVLATANPQDTQYGSAPDINIDAAGHTLTLTMNDDLSALAEDAQMEGYVAPMLAAIGTGNDQKATVNVTADTLNIARKDSKQVQGFGLSGMSTGILADNNAAVNIKGNVNVSGINGPAVAAGLYGGGNGDGGYLDNSITIDGDLNIKNSTMGVDLLGGQGRIIVRGKTTISDVDTATWKDIPSDMSRDAGLSVGATTGFDSLNSDDISNILSPKAAIIVGAADINAGEGYNAARVNRGSIFINVGQNDKGIEGTTLGITKITGNLAAEEGQIVLSLGGEESYLKGLALAGDRGSIDLELLGGAYWDNSGKTTNSSLSSRINHLTSETGRIFMNDASDLAVNQFSGSALVFYTHNKSDPTSINGGSVRIADADKGSDITLITDQTGLEASFKPTATTVDKNKANEVLNKLAQKLYYTGTSGNLTGRVIIAEGLLMSSKQLTGGQITFSDGTNGTRRKGQGFYEYESLFKSGPITESEALKETREIKNGRLSIAADTITTTNAHGSNVVSAMYAANPNAATYSSPMTVDLTGTNLNLSADAPDDSGGLTSTVYVGNNVHMAVKDSAATDRKTPKTLTLSATNEDSRASNAIYVDDNADLSIAVPVVIDGVTTNSRGVDAIQIQGGRSNVTFDGPLTIKNVDATSRRSNGLQRMGINNAGDNSTVTVKGNVDISGIKGSALRTAGVDSVISVGGGTITAPKDTKENYYAARVEKGTININMDGADAGTNTTKITGDLYSTGQYGKRVVEYSGGQLVDYTNAGNLNVALTNKDSFWTGVAAYDQYTNDYGAGGNRIVDIGNFNLYLQNGAVWTNEQQSRVTNGNLNADQQNWEGSVIATLHGGKDAASSGIIVQKDANPITVLNYEGDTTVAYSHDIVDDTSRENAVLYGNKAASIIGGDFKITNAAKGAAITLVTDAQGLATKSDLYTAKNLVNDTLDKLANKLYYSGYADGNLTAKVRIAEGLVSSSITKSLTAGDVSFYTDKDAGKTAGQGHYAYDLAKAPAATEQATGTFNTGILGSPEWDSTYVDQGVLKDDGVYHFTKDTTISIDGAKDAAEETRDRVWGGTFTASTINAAISGARPKVDLNGKDDDGKADFNQVTIDMNGKALNMDVNWAQGGGSAIAAVGTTFSKDVTQGKVEINNAGPINITHKSTGISGGLFANRGGQLIIHNGGEDAENKILTIRATATNGGTSAAGIKTMNDGSGARTENGQSEITIDGLVDVLADGKADKDGYSANEGVSAVASDINIGGGTIKAVNGAWAAIRAYGEMISGKYGIVNFNAANRKYVIEETPEPGMGGKSNWKQHKVSDFDIGDYKAVLEGDIVTNGGMGTKGQINIGMKGKDSHWIGNYADTKGYGVTQGQLGAVNLKLADGAYWKGFGNGAMTLSMTGADTNWLGFNIDKGANMQLALNDGATWYNAITQGQKDQDGNAAEAYIGNLSGKDGIIDMTGANVFVAESESLSGQPVKTGASSITESRNGVTGNVNIADYSGSHTVVYRHDIVTDTDRDNAAMYGNKAASIIGGDFKIDKAAKDASITLVTDRSGLNTTSDLYTDVNLVNDTLAKLANKLFYTSYADGNLTAKVRIAEGLVSSSITKSLKEGDVSFYTDKDAGKTAGQGHYDYELTDRSASQDTATFGTAILGSRDRDGYYVQHGVLKDDGTYQFTQDTTFKIDGAADKAEQSRDLIYGDNWVAKNIYAAISGALPQKDADGNTVKDAGDFNQVTMDMNGKALNMDINWTGGGTAISAIGTTTKNGQNGKVEINNAGPMDLNITTPGLSAALFVDRGGKILIHNGGEDAENKVIKARAYSTGMTNAAVIKTMNGMSTTYSGKGLQSEITIDGLVDVLADGKADANGYATNEAVSAVASDINIGGGTIKATNGAWAAIRAYGEFVSQNYGIVNFNTKNRQYSYENNGNVHKVSNFDIGDYKAVVEGDLVTNGGMGTKGQINVGMKGADSHWIGNYADTRGYGVTQGQFGAVNLKMADGSYWKGFGNGSMNVSMTGKDTYWLGFNMSKKANMQLALNDGATWYNAITQEQKDQSNNHTEAYIGSLTGNGGIIDMTGANVFVASGSSLSGNPVKTGDTAIAESQNGVTGNVNIADYSGSHTVLYRHEIVNTDTRNNAPLYDNKAVSIIGGDITIGKAEKDSTITLITDTNGLKLDSELYSDKNLVNDALNKLAGKLYYTSYTDGNLTAKVQLAEGLVASSRTKTIREGNVAYYTDQDAGKTPGQGHYDYEEIIPAGMQDVGEFNTAILGSRDRDGSYVNHGVLRDDGIYSFVRDTTFKIDGAADKEEQNRDLVYGDTWVAQNIYSAISGAKPQVDGEGKKTTNSGDFNQITMDMNGNALNMDVNWTGGGTAIAAIGTTTKDAKPGKVEINNAGPMDINITTPGLSAALFANRGGQILIHNGGEGAEGKVLKARASSKGMTNAAVIKTMNGLGKSGEGKQSVITIDGLVDVLADGKADANGYATNEAVSAVASDINIGGGTIKAINGAWAAIRAYGEFVSPNYGIVNFNTKNRQYTLENNGAVHKVSDFDIGDYRAVVEGDIVTNGGMGTKGQINIGMKGKDSHWIGNYADTRGYGVTQGEFGNVNLKMADGSYWKGFGNGSMNVSMTGKDTYWLGFNMSQKANMQLALNDGATWYNAITQEQKDQSNRHTEAYVGNLTGNGGIIDMTGANVFVASGSSLSGNPVKTGDSAIVESQNGVTGNVNIVDYSGSHTVVYRHDIVDTTTRKNALLYNNKEASIIGGDFKITKAEKDSSITLVTDKAGLNTRSKTYSDVNLVNETLNKLANKLYYTGYADGNLTAKVRIAEGLVSSSMTKVVRGSDGKNLEKDVAFYTDQDAGKTAGQGHYDYEDLAPAGMQDVKNFGKAILGSADRDTYYADHGVLKDGTYSFIRDTTISVDGTTDTAEGKRDVVAGGPYVTSGVAAVISGSKPLYDDEGKSISQEGYNSVTMDLNGNALNLKAKYDTGAGQTGISAIGTGKVELNHPGAVNIDVKGSGMTAGLFVNGGGKIAIHNDGEDKAASIVTIRTGAKNKASGIGIKTMNGGGASGKGQQSEITIDGLVDILADGQADADGYSSNAAISAVASDVNIGGGTIRAINGAAAAIQAYGEYNTKNDGVVNINTTNISYDISSDGNTRTVGSFDAGDHKVVVEGDIVTSGGMNANGQVNIGLKGKDSYWLGNYGGTGSAVTGGLGKVNLKLEGGAYWKGFANGPMSVSLTGDGTHWTGFNLSKSGNMQLTLNDKAVWYNAITADQVGADNKPAEAYVGTLSGTDGIIDMTGSNVFTADSASVAAASGMLGASSIKESTDGVTGSVNIDNYSGSHTVVYRHQIETDSTRDHAMVFGNKRTDIIGGDIRINHAAEGSTIVLVTDKGKNLRGNNNGLPVSSSKYQDVNLVNDTLDRLANKLFYTSYADGNLTAKVRIAEGLVSSSITRVVSGPNRRKLEGDVSFYTDKDEGKTAGQGHYVYDLIYPDKQEADPMSTVIDGSDHSKDVYRDAGIYKDKTDSYDFTKKPATVKTDGESESLIHAGDHNVSVNTQNLLKLEAKDGGTAIHAENGKTVATKGNLEITAKGGTGIQADGGTVNVENDNTISAKTGVEALNGGKVTTTGQTDITAEEGGKALHADGEGSTITLQNGIISGAVLAENQGAITAKGADFTSEVTAASNGTITLDGGTAAALTADDGTISTSGTDISGVLSAVNGGTASMTNGTAKGLSADSTSTVKADLTGEDAKLDGDVANDGTASVKLADGASWTGNSTGTGDTAADIGAGSTWTGASTNDATTVNLAGTWKQTAASSVASVTGNGGTLDKTDHDSGDTSIGRFSGKMNLIYAHDSADPSHIYGGTTTIGTAAAGSEVTLITDNAGFDMSNSNAVYNAFDQLARKLHYTANDGNLKGNLHIAEGLLSSSATLRAEDVTFEDSGIGRYVDYQEGPEETQVMRGTKSVLLGIATMWRSNNNDLQRRMGDLRLGTAEHGTWARYIGGRTQYSKDNVSLSQTYDIGQVGYDKKVGDWTIGGAVDYGTGTAHVIGGRSREHMHTFSAYGAKISDDGQYFDVILKAGRVGSKFHVSSEYGFIRADANYDTWGTSLSMEYGKRFTHDNGFYLDPNVEFTMGRLNGKNFTADATSETMYVRQKAYNSAIGRIGLSLGQQTKRSNLFAKFALAHEFGGDFLTDYRAGNESKSTRIGIGGDTWVDMELGGSISLTRDTYLYGTYTRSFGADMSTKWRADVGVRFSF